ncbi:transposase [Streptomyces mirabilis]
MGETQKTRTGRHCAFVMHVHLVFVTKFRHKVFHGRSSDAYGGDHAVGMRGLRGANKLWSGSYFAGTVGGAPLSVVKEYIEQRNRPV